MPPTPLVDLSQVDLNRIEDDIEGIRKYNQQRYEMEMLTGVIRYDPQGGYVIAFKDATASDFWTRGHVPGRPLMPGVLICECAAQACSYYYGRGIGQARFLGFGGMEHVRFRGQVLPGDRLIMVAKANRINPRISTFDCQGFVGERMVFEGGIQGVIL